MVHDSVKDSMKANLIRRQSDRGLPMLYLARVGKYIPPAAMKILTVWMLADSITYFRLNQCDLLSCSWHFSAWLNSCEAILLFSQTVAWKAQTHRPVFWVISNDRFQIKYWFVYLQQGTCKDSVLIKCLIK